MTRENTVNVPLTSASEVFGLMDGTDPIDRILKASGVDDSTRITVAYALIADRKDRALSAAPLHEGEGIGYAPLLANLEERRSRMTEVSAGMLVNPDGPEAAAAIRRLIAAPPPSVEVERLREALEHLVRCDDDARNGLQNGAGLLDCIDNHGRFYPSADLDAALTKARAALSRKQEPGVPTPGGEGE